jgi:hypothetical protein
MLVRKKTWARVLCEVAIYPWIDNSYRWNEHPRVENVLKFNPTKELSERHIFSQSNGELKP